MQTTPLGTTGLEVSALSLGTIYFGTELDREQSFAFLDRYYEAGGRFVDTANNYATWLDGYDEPMSEVVIGEWLAERGVREEVTVATKLGFGADNRPESLAPELIEREVDRSRERLGVETIDLLYAHVDDYDTPQVDTMRALGRAVEEGTVEHLGASNFLAWRVARANRIAAERGWAPYECVQPRFSYYVPDRGADFGAQVPATDELVSYCEHEDLTLLPYSPTLQGAYGREDRGVPEEYVRTENRIKRDVVAEVADRRGLNGNQVVLAWMLHREAPTVPVIGFSTMAQLEQNLAALDVAFTDAELRRLNGVESLGASPARE